MTPARFIMATSILVFGCGHTTAIETPPASDGGAKEKPAARAAPVEPKKTPVTESPEAQLKPGAEAEIRGKLTSSGFLGANDERSLAAALREFQASRDLPTTGVADEETVRQLGLDPERIFRRAKPQAR
jgi:Putative peptidoglycan binding domain